MVPSSDNHVVDSSSNSIMSVSSTIRSKASSKMSITYTAESFDYDDHNDLKILQQKTVTPKELREAEFKPIRLNEQQIEKLMHRINSLRARVADGEYQYLKAHNMTEMVCIKIKYFIC